MTGSSLKSTLRRMRLVSALSTWVITFSDSSASFKSTESLFMSRSAAGSVRDMMNKLIARGSVWKRQLS